MKKSLNQESNIISSATIIPWIRLIDLKTSKNIPLTWENHPFMVQPLTDWAPNIVFKKPTQVGFSTIATTKILYTANKKNISAIYTLPTTSDVRKFVTARVDPMLENCPYLKAKMKPFGVTIADSTELKRIGGSTLYYRGCVDEKTEILTCRGWQNIKTIRNKEKIPTINLETKNIEIQKINKIFKYDYDGNLIHFLNNNIDLLVTPEHRCVYQSRRRKDKKDSLQIKTANKINAWSSDYIPLRTKGWEGIKDKKMPDSLVKIIGWVITEGSFEFKKNKKKPSKYPRISICQKVNKKELRKDLLEAKIKYSIHKRQNGDIFRIRAKDSKKIFDLIPTKELESKFLYSLTYKQLKLLFNVLILGDGCFQKYRNRKSKIAFFQASERTASAFQILCILLGYNCKDTIRIFKKHENHFGKKPIHCLQIKWSEFTNQFEKKERYYKGKVWCPNVKNGTIFTRRNGKITITAQSWTEQQAQSIDADIVVIDELDFSKPEIAEMYEERLEGASSLGWMYQFSVPSIPGVGIDRLYEESCQYEWYNKCPKCKKLQTLNIFENLDRKNKIYRCKFCKSEFTDEARKSGVWVPRYPKRKVHGYYISQLAAPWISAEKLILKEEKAKSKKHFYNYSLGLAYEMSNKLIGEKELYRMVTGPEQATSADGTVVGIDQGDIFYIVIGRLEPVQGSDLLQKRVIALLTADSEEQLITILKRFGIRFGIMDAMPNKHTAKKISKLFFGKLFLSYYQTGMASKSKFDVVDWNISEHTVHVQRTESLDNLIEGLDNGQWVLPKFSDNVKVLIKHVKNIVIKYVTRFGLTVKVYDHNGPDHFFHALNYLNLAFEKAPRFMSGTSNTDPGVRYSTINDNNQIELPSINDIINKKDGITRVDVLDN
jgi:hypothetical protein